MRRSPLIIAALSVAVLAAMALTVQTRLGRQSLPRPAAQPAQRTADNTLPVLSESVPEFSGIAEWINSAPLTPAGLKGKVVLVDFWTYSCINCIRALPAVIALDKLYRRAGLQVVGIHTPEFAFEKEPANVRQAVARFGIEYPVALDNGYGTWNNFANNYWPAQYLFDVRGRLRYTSIGEGHAAETTKAVQELLAEAGLAVEKEVALPETNFDPSRIGTPETYIGYGRQQFLGNGEQPLRDQPQYFQAPDRAEYNLFYLDGTWQVEAGQAVLKGSPGRILYRYKASNANLVMGAPGGGIRAEVRLDGQPVPAGLRGADVRPDDGRTYVLVAEQRLYSLIDAQGDYAEHLLEIIFPAPGVEAYAFTFG